MRESELAEYIQKYVDELECLHDQLKHDVQFLKLTEKEDITIKQALYILAEKIKKIRKAKDIDAIKKIMKINKFIEGYIYKGKE